VHEAFGSRNKAARLWKHNILHVVRSQVGHELQLRLMQEPDVLQSAVL
jgi:hypothetical protein